MHRNDEHTVTVYRTGNTFFVQSAYSESLDIVINTWYQSSSNMPNEQAFLVEKGSSILDCCKGELLHRNGDEFPAYRLGDEDSYCFMGGNHGSPFGRMLTVSHHGMDTPELGTELTDDQGYKYCIISIPDNDHILIHPFARKYGYPEFADLKDGQQIFLNGEALTYSEIRVCQVLQSNRINHDILLVDGQNVLPDKTVVKCSFLKHIFEYEIVMPEARVDMFKNAPGVKHDFIDKSLPALMRIRFENVYQPYGACVTRITNTVLHKFNYYRCLGVMMGWGNIEGCGTISTREKTEFYIPKLKPLKASASGKHSTLAFDFTAVQDLPEDKESKVNYMIVKSDCINPEDPPDRFIRLSGDKGVRKYGSVLGYSLIEGSTAKEFKAADRPDIYHLYYSRKSYPYCSTVENPEPGDVRHITAYRQYFDPQREPDTTSFYWNRQGESDIVYLDFHKNISRKTIKLPAYMTGKRISVIEQTPGVTLHTLEIVRQEGLCLSVKDNYGYIVLKLD